MPRPKLNKITLLSLCRDRRDPTKKSGTKYERGLYSSRDSEYFPYVPFDNNFTESFIKLHPWEASYLFDVCSFCEHGAVETGRYAGGSTLLMASSTKFTVHSFDIRPKDDDRLRYIMKKYSYDNIKLYTANSQKTDMSQKINYDMIFVDGDHSYNGCFNDLSNWYPNLKIGGHVILHDSFRPYNVPKAVIDYTLDKKVRFFLSPFNVTSAISPYGSLCHFQKLDN